MNEEKKAIKLTDGAKINLICYEGDNFLAALGTKRYLEKLKESDTLDVMDRKMLVDSHRFFLYDRNYKNPYRVVARGILKSKEDEK